MRTFLSLVLIVVTINITKAQNDVIKGVTCHEAFELIQLHLDDPNFVIIDLRPEKMYMDEHIQDAIYYDVFSKQFDAWANNLDKNKTYLLYCTIGKRSKIAFDKMKSMGFKHLYHMSEGIKTWAGGSYKTVKINSELPWLKKRSIMYLVGQSKKILICFLILYQTIPILLVSLREIGLDSV